MEHADLKTRDTDEQGIPRELRRWLAERGLSFAGWRADQRRKQDPDTAALALQRRRLKLISKHYPWGRGGVRSLGR